MCSKSEADKLVELLEWAIRAGQSVVNECAQTKPLVMWQNWAIALLAKVCGTGLAVRTLTRHGHTHDAKVLVRSMYEGLLDLNYILHGPLTVSKLDKLFQLEIIEDEYSELSFEAGVKRRNPAHLAAQSLERRRILEFYDRAKRHPLWNRRWRHLKVEDKLRALSRSLSKCTKYLDFPIRGLGNAHAHSRPAALQHYMRKKSDGSRGFVTRPKPEGLYDRRWVAVEALLSVLFATDLVIDGLYLHERFSRRIDRIVARLVKNPESGRVVGKALQ